MYNIMIVDNDTDDSKDVSGPEHQSPKAAPPRDRNRRLKNGPHSHPATQNNGQSMMEPFGYKGPGNPASQTLNMIMSFQQQAVFNQGKFVIYRILLTVSFHLLQLLRA